MAESTESNPNESNVGLNVATGETPLQWTEHSAPDGRKYYYCEQTAESTWERYICCSNMSSSSNFSLDPVN